MIRNIYKETLDKITISDVAIERGITAVKKIENEGEVINMKKIKTVKVKIVGVVAASMAVLVALGTVFVLDNVSGNESSFIIKAGAEEITDSTLVAVTSVNAMTGGSSNDYYNWDYNFIVNCSGENIEEITYSINNASFLVKENCKNITDKIECGSQKNTSSYDDYTRCSSYTVKYNNQIDEPDYWYSEEENGKFEGIYNDNYPVKLSAEVSAQESETAKNALQYLFDCRMYRAGLNNSISDKNFSFDKEKKIYATKEVFNRLWNDITIDVTVTFADGTIKVKTIELSADYTILEKCFDDYQSIENDYVAVPKAKLKNIED